MKEFMLKLLCVVISLIILSYYWIPTYEYHMTEAKLSRCNRFSGEVHVIGLKPYHSKEKLM